MCKVTCLPPYFILQGRACCWKCGSSFDVVGFEASKGEDHGALLSNFYLMYAEDLPAELLDEVRRTAPFRKVTNRFGDSFFSNVCSVCGNVIEDYCLYKEAGGAFLRGKYLTKVIASYSETMRIKTLYSTELSCGS